MTALDKDQESILAEPETIDEIASGETDLGSGEHPKSAAEKRISAQVNTRNPEPLRPCMNCGGWNSVRSICRSWGSCIHPTLTMSPTSRD
jgi:hypothetical protein